MLVWGPTGTSQIPSVARQVSTMKVTASVPSRGVVGVGRSAPSSPDSPWTNGAKWVGSTSGRSLPEWTGTSIPRRSRITSAFRVVRSSGAFPATVVMPTRSANRAAAMIATASSWPGSQSRMIDGPVLDMPAFDMTVSMPSRRAHCRWCPRCPSRDWWCVPSRRSWCCRRARAAVPTTPPMTPPVRSRSLTLLT